MWPLCQSPPKAISLRIGRLVLLDWRVLLEVHIFPSVCPKLLRLYAFLFNKQHLIVSNDQGSSCNPKHGVWHHKVFLLSQPLVYHDILPQTMMNRVFIAIHQRI